MKSVLAVLGGLVLSGICVMAVTFGAAAVLDAEFGAPTPPYLAVNLGGGAAAAAFGGYLTARLAPRAPRFHALALAAVMLVLALPMAFAPPAVGQPDWYPWAIALLSPLFAMLGAVLAPAPGADSAET